MLTFCQRKLTSSYKTQPARWVFAFLHPRITLMAAPNPAQTKRRAMHSELVRDRIRTTALLNRLQGYLLGNKDPRTKKPIHLEPHQVAGILGLLRKALPDLQSIEHSGEVEHKHHVVQADPLTPEQWAEKYGAPAARPN
jgi:hypothetical protein